MNIDKITKSGKFMNKSSILISLAVLILVIIGCDTGPASITSLKTAKDKDGKEASAVFKADDKIFARADISNNLENTKIRSNMTAAEDLEGLKKGEIFPGTDSTEDFKSESDIQWLEYSHPDGFPVGKYKINMELMDKEGKKLDSKSVEITIE